MGRYWRYQQLENDEHWKAGQLVEDIKRITSASEFGFIIQGLAAHILLRLGAGVLEINSSGHPDIVAEYSTHIVRYEIEADMGGYRDRLLTQADINSLSPKKPTDKGYFALALCGPYPSWVLLDYSVIRRRTIRTSPIVLRTLSDKQASDLWTKEFISLILRNQKNLKLFSFDYLCRLAIEGRPL